MKINKTWHEAHKMPAKATKEQRVLWHVAHAGACNCRNGDMPADIREYISSHYISHIDGYEVNEPKEHGVVNILREDV